jgi:ParB family chromosome partitioning protein
MANKAHQRRALGRGLSALIPLEAEDVGSQSGTEQVDINAIAVNPFQPRTDFAQEEIDGLARSIEAQGLLQPLIVRKKVDGYELVSGERRLRALRQLGWDRIPCIVRRKVSDREMLELALVENVQRENLNEIELATAYQRLLLDCKLSHEQLSERVGKSRSAITNSLRLLKLPASVQEMVRRGGLSMGHARALLTLEDAGRQKELAQRAVDKGLSVRDVEDTVREQVGARPDRAKAGRSARTAPAQNDPDQVQHVEQLQYRYGTAVRVIPRGSGGRFEIRYHDADDFVRVMNLLLGRSG